MFLMGLLGRGKSTATQQTAAAGLQVQTSVQGRPIALIYGMTRIAPNLIWYGNFTATQQSSSVGGKGGLTGGGGKGGGSGTYTYSASFELALGEGPLNSIFSVYADKNITDVASLGMSFFKGTYQQAPWTYLLESEGQVDNELHTIAGSPYQVTTNQPFLYDIGVTITTSGGALTRKAVSQGSLVSGQYNDIVQYGSAFYYFSSADNGKQVILNYTASGQPKSFTGTISGGQIVLSQITAWGFADGGVNYIVGAPLTKVSGSPASGQYSESAGVYTFSSAQSGSQIFIDYVPNNGQSTALGYSGIGYVAAANYSLGNNPSLPNFNFEVGGAFTQQVQQQVQGEQYTLPTSGLLQITVRFATYFISDAGVTDQTGNVYTKVSNSPGTNQYTVSGTGIYFFGSGNAGQIVNISYNSSLGPDADPSAVINDLLTNAHYGIGFPSGRVGSLSIYQAYCLATGLVISPCYDTQQQASSMLDEISALSENPTDGPF